MASLVISFGLVSVRRVQFIIKHRCSDSPGAYLEFYLRKAYKGMSPLLVRYTSLE
jgi:hypothetical protein